MIYDLMENELTGPLILAGDDQGLHHLNFVKGRHPIAIDPAWRRDTAYFSDVKAQLTAYFAGESRAFAVALCPQGSAFQLLVWRALEEIPYGRTVSYRWIAERIGKPKAVRAVGAANGRNPISIIIPCHRVIGSDGSLTGYGGGLAVKRRLLQLENLRHPLASQATLPFAGV